MGCSDKRLRWRGWLRIKEWTGDRDCGDRLFQERRRLFWSEFDKGDSLGSSTTAEGYLARGSGIAHPGDLAIGRHKPALPTCLDERDRRGVLYATASATHRQQIGVSRSQPHMEEDSHEPIKEAAPAAQAIGRGQSP